MPLAQNTLRFNLLDMQYSKTKIINKTDNKYWRVYVYDIIHEIYENIVILYRCSSYRSLIMANIANKFRILPLHYSR